MKQNYCFKQENYQNISIARVFGFRSVNSILILKVKNLLLKRSKICRIFDRLITIPKRSFFIDMRLAVGPTWLKREAVDKITAAGEPTNRCCWRRLIWTCMQTPPNPVGSVGYPLGTYTRYCVERYLRVRRIELPQVILEHKFQSNKQQ